MDNNTNITNQFAKEFEIETSQIKYWFDTLGDVKRQIEVLKDGVESETKLYETLGKSMQLMSKGYLNDSAQYMDEPSNLGKVFKTFMNLVDNVGKTFYEDILILNVQASKFHSLILNEISSLKKNIVDTSNTLMQEIQELKKKSKNIQAKYEKLKSELEEAHTNKKKLENDPKYFYNVSMKEKAEKKILDYIKQMQELMPDIENCSKELEKKKNLFNANMKQTFELVISTVFKSNIKINQTFFMVSKEKFEIMQKMKQKASECCKGILDVDLQLNDYVERKFAEKRKIYFDSIDLMRIGDNLFDGSLITVADSLINYTNNFYSCMKMRKRGLQIFAKMISDHSKSEEVLSSNYSKVNKNVMTLTESFHFIGRGCKKNWDLFKNSFDINYNLHDYIAKYLASNVYNLILNIAKETKTDYTSFLESWSRRAKDILSYKAVLQKFQANKDRIQGNIKELRNIYTNTPNKMDKSKYESKLSSYYTEENNLKQSFEESAKKIKVYFETSLDLLKKTIKLIREKEFKRLNTFIETIESVGKNFEKTFEQNIQFSKSQMNMSAGADIFEDVKEVFEGYFNKFKISNYDGFLEKVIRKTLDKFSNDFTKTDKGENLNNIFNSYFNNNHSNILRSSNNLVKLGMGSSLNPVAGIKKFDSGGSGVSADGITSQYLNMSNEKYFGNNNFSDLHVNSEINPNKFNSMNRKPENNFKNTGFMNDIEEEIIDNNPHLSRTFSKNEIESPTPVQSVHTLEDEKMNFVNYDNFNMLDTKNPYNNIKENDLKEYLEKIKKTSNRVSINPAAGANGLNLAVNDRASVNSNKTPVDQGSFYENIFPIEESELVFETYSCAYKNKILLQGKLYVTNKKIVFYSWFNNKTLFGHTKLIVPLADIVKVEKKYNLKIFDNSIKITTKKSELFFTSFVYRDACYKMIYEHWEVVRLQLQHEVDRLNKEEEEGDEGEAVDGNNQNRGMMRISQDISVMKSNYIAKMLKKMDFINQLERVHQQRLSEFEKSEKCFKPEEYFKKTYYKDEPLANCPLTLVYQQLFDRNSIAEELGKGKCFWESLYELRNDYDMKFEYITENNSAVESPPVEVPKFFDDLESSISLFSNPDEEAFNSFLSEVPSWSRLLKYNYTFIHPIKKKLIGPDRLKLRQEFNIYFVSPKCFVVEDVGFGFDFPYADSFITVLQYKFMTNYKYNTAEGIFKFNTTCTISFNIQFVKSCFFKGMIEEEGYKESFENVSLNTWEKFKTVVDSQSQIFNQHFEILSEENMRKTLNTGNLFFNNDNVDGVARDENANQMGEYVSESDDESENENEKKGWKIQKSNEFHIYGSGKLLSKKNFILLSTLMPIIILLTFIFSKVNFEVTINISFEKIFNVVIIVLIGVLFYRFNVIMNKEGNK